MFFLPQYGSLGHAHAIGLHSNSYLSALFWTALTFKSFFFSWTPLYCDLQHIAAPREPPNLSPANTRASLSGLMHPQRLGTSSLCSHGPAGLHWVWARGPQRRLHLPPRLSVSSQLCPHMTNAAPAAGTGGELGVCFACQGGGGGGGGGSHFCVWMGRMRGHRPSQASFSLLSPPSTSGL